MDRKFDFQNYHITRFKCFHLQQQQQKITKHTKDTEKCLPFKGNNKPTETVLEKDPMAGLLDKIYINICSTNVLKGLKEDMEKS